MQTPALRRLNSRRLEALTVLGFFGVLAKSRLHFSFRPLEELIVGDIGEVE